MATLKPKHNIEHNLQKNHSEHKPKISNAVLGIVSIFAIFLIAYFAITFDRVDSTANNGNIQSVDSAGQAIQVLSAGDASTTANTQVTTSNVASCKIIVGQTTIYDDNTLAVSLETGSSTYYAGYSVTVNSINDNGCVVDISGTNDYLAIGQIERIGSLYVTVKDVLK